MSICQNNCPSKDGCTGDCPDFEIKRHDTTPPFAIEVSDCNGPLVLTNCVVEVSMWAKGRLRKPLAKTDTYFALADNIGFEQSFVGDIIVMERARAPEQMLIVGHDEVNRLIAVQRGYNGTPIGSYPRGSCLRIFRVLNSVGETEMTFENITEIDGTINNTLTSSQLLYNWKPNDTCLPGCYWLEFKLLKMMTVSSMDSWLMNPIIPTFTTVSPSPALCGMGAGVESVRRFPVNRDGFLIKITDSPSAENVV